MDYTDRTQRTYDVIAEEYLNDHADETWDDDYLELFASLVPTGAAILELGCGPGVEVKKLRLRGLHVHGLDISERLLAIARRLNPDTSFTRADMRKLPFDDGTFAGIFAKASLLHISKEDTDTVIAGARRVLTPSGVFHIAVEKARPDQADAFVTESDYGFPYTRYFSYWTLPELTARLADGGFNVLHATETQSPETDTTWIKVIARRNP